MPDAAAPMMDQQPPLMQGSVEGRDLFEVVKLLVKTGKSGLLSIHVPDGARAEIWLERGAIVAAFFNGLNGSQALTRTILIGTATWTFERHVGKYPRNVTHETARILESIERILVECGDRLWGPAAPAAATDADDDGLSPSDAPGDPATLLIAAFSPPEVGKSIGKCLLEAEIGRGASAIVYKATHSSLGLPVVVKVLMQGSEDQEQHRTLTRLEAQLLSRLNHPNVLRVFDFDDRGHFPHVVMEFIDGASLAELIAASGHLEADLVLPLFCQVTEGMAHAHAAAGVVHCDLKPSNILVSAAMQAKVIDFGLAKTTRMSDTQRAARAAITGIAGTPHYIAPEQVEGGWDSATHRSDLYSLGATFYHALVGRPPFEDPDPIELMAKRLRIDPVPPHLVRQGVDRGLSDLVMALLERDPARRVHTWDDCLTMLYALAEKRDEEEQRQAGNDKIIRRRTSFWTQVPARLIGGKGKSGAAG